MHISFAVVVAATATFAFVVYCMREFLMKYFFIILLLFISIYKHLHIYIYINIFIRIYFHYNFLHLHFFFLFIFIHFFMSWQRMCRKQSTFHIYNTNMYVHIYVYICEIPYSILI